MQVRSLLVLAAALAVSSSACSGGGAGPPNVVLISIDTLRPDHLGCYGHDRDTSPTIDALAAGGVLFEDVTSASPWTLPSHASMLTGLYPSRHSLVSHENILPQHVPTLATLMAANGYSTAAVINSHNLSERYGMNRGFEAFHYVEEINQKSRPIPNRGPQILTRAREWLEARDERPFFLFLHFYDVHTDFTPDEKYRKRFVSPYDGPVDGSTRQLSAWRTGEVRIPDDGLQHLRELYDAEIRQLDDLLGVFFAYLEQRELAQNTVVAIVSDHGEEFLEHGSYLHGRTYFQEVIRIPLILKGPGVPAGMRIGRPVHLVDVAPTLLGLAGIGNAGDMDGLDLEPLWSGREDEFPERLLFAEADHNNTEFDMYRLLRSPRHKLLYDRLTGQLRLFDLEHDPLERVDLSETKADLVGELMRNLESFLSGAQEGEVIGLPDEDTLRKLEELGY